MKNEYNLKPLDYKIMNISSMEQNNLTNLIPPEKLPKLLRKNGIPWSSERFCHYPQRIIIKFPYLVNLFQINILSDSKKISRRLQFYYYFPDDIENKNNYNDNEIPFKRLGFVNLRDNKQCNYTVREYKKIFIKIRCLYLKIELERNYPNTFNKFQQVGISSIECLGRYMGKYLNMLSSEDNIDDSCIHGNVKRILRETCPDTYDNLNKYVNNRKNIDYTDYEEIKGRLNELNKDAKKIYQIELLEKESSKDNDFDKAIEYRNKKEKSKYILKNKASEINKLYKNEFDTNNLYLENEQKKNKYNNKYNNKNNRKIGKNNENDQSLFNSNTFIDMNSNNNSNRKMKKNYSAPDIISENDTKIINQKKQIIPLEELDPKYLNTFKTLTNFINQDGLRNLLSSKIANKLEGFKLLNSKLDEIFSSPNGNIINTMYELLELLGLILEDKNTLFLKQISDLIETIVDKIEKDEKMKNNTKLMNLFNKNIVNKVKENIGEGTELKKLGKFDKATELLLLILDKNIINLDNTLKSLLTNDINVLNSNDNFNNTIQNNKLYSKLNILKKILEDFDNKINENITSKETFPKDIIAEFILLNMKNKDIKIRKLIEDLLQIYIELFGLDYLKEKSLLIFNEDEFKKLSNQFPSLKPLFNKLLANPEVNIFIPCTLKEKSLIKNSIEINLSDKKPKKIENICELCKMNLDSNSIEEHSKVCKMYSLCEGCGEYIKVELLNNHKLDFCKNKKNYKQCNKCKEAIQTDLYKIHIDKNLCNPLKINMSRCPFCHHDIEKDQQGFYQHLVVDGCAYQNNM